MPNLNIVSNVEDTRLPEKAGLKDRPLVEQVCHWVRILPHLQAIISSNLSR